MPRSGVSRWWAGTGSAGTEEEAGAAGIQGREPIRLRKAARRAGQPLVEQGPVICVRRSLAQRAKLLRTQIPAPISPCHTPDAKVSKRLAM
ncbi:hypothetical protein CT3_31700 [Comamonas terrigena NBRC 13299]|nr:hypothetical protein CT3_31700 [Comamonas terrigena NBRC 13299]